jgi:hypothetical protein
MTTSCAISRRRLTGISAGVIAGIVLLMGMPSAHADAPGASRTEAATQALKAMGAQILYRDESNGPGKIVISTDGSWRGGDAGLARLKEVDGLYKLRLGGPITDAGLRHVAALHGLTALDVHVVGISDAGVRELAPLTQLERLNLTYTKVTDAGLKSLTGMTRLKWLGLAYTQVTARGVEELKESLAVTIIEGDFQR